MDISTLERLLRDPGTELSDLPNRPIIWKGRIYITLQALNGGSRCDGGAAIGLVSMLRSLGFRPQYLTTSWWRIAKNRPVSRHTRTWWLPLDGAVSAHKPT